MDIRTKKKHSAYNKASLFIRTVLLSKYSVVVIFIIALLLRIYGSSYRDLYYDEGATWYISTFSSFRDLLLGNYTFDGSPPFPYFVYKVFLLFARSEFEIRLSSVFFGLVSLYISYKIFLLSKNKFFATCALLLLAISPLHIHYSREFRYYILGFAAQAVSLYFYYKHILEGSKSKYLFFSALGFFIAIFSTFSSFYLLNIFLITELWLQISVGKKISKGFILSILSLCALFACWFASFVFFGGGSIALQNYSGLHNRDILYAIWYSFTSLFFFRLTWGILPGTHILDPFIDQLIPLFSVTVSVLFIYYIFYSVKDILNKNSRKIESIYSVKKNSMEYTLLISQILAFIGTFLISIVVSIFYINVISPKLLLPLMISSTWILLYIYRAVYRTCARIKKGTILVIVLVSGISLLYILLTGANVSRPKYTIRPLFDEIYSQSNSSDCSYLLLSHEIGIAEVLYYENVTGKYLPAQLSVIPMNFTALGQMDQVRSKIRHLSNAEGHVCARLLFLHYYDVRLDSNYPEDELTVLLKTRFNLSRSIVIDPCCLSLDIYERKKENEHFN